MSKLDSYIAGLRQSDPFVSDDGFGQLDLSGCPGAIQAQLEDLKEERSDPFEKADYMGSSAERAKDLRQFLINLPADALEDAARMPGASPNLKATVLDEQAVAVAEEFLCKVGPDWFKSDDNVDCLVRAMCGRFLGFVPGGDTERLIVRLQSKGLWTAANMESVFRRLFRDGELVDYPENTYRPLTRAQWTELARVSQGGGKNILDAIAQGIRWALDIDDDDPSSISAVDRALVNPELAPLANGLILFCWQSAQPDFDSREDNAFHEFVKEFAGGRPFTLPMLNAAWSKYEKEKRSVLLDERFDLPEPDLQEFHDLSDDQVKDLYRRTLAERSSRR